MRGGRAVVVIVGVALLAAGCSSAKDTSSSAGSGTVSQAGVSVEVPPGAFEPGIKVTVERVPAPEGSGEFLVKPVVEIRADGDRQPAHPVTLRFPPAPFGQRLWIAYLDPDSEWWLPVETKTDPATGELVAVVDHFSRWARFVESVQKGASWVEYRGFKALGNRASRPHCDGGMPEWVAGELIVNPDENAELFACGYRAGDDAVLKIVNNRGYPVTVEFSRPFASSSLSLPTTLGDLVQRVSNPGTSTRLFLVGTGSGEVRFTRPTQPVSGVVEGFARRDGGTMLTNVVFDLADAAGADLPVGGGKTLGVASLECLAAQGSAVSGSAEGIRTRDAGRVGGAVAELGGCMEVVVDAELARAVPNSDAAKRLRGARKILRALTIWDFTQQAADAFINDATPEAELVDVSFRWKLPVTIHTIDLRNATLPARSCELGAWLSPEPIPLVNGSGHSGDRSKDPGPAATYDYVEASIGEPQYADLDRDGTMDAVVTVGCSAGGTAVDQVVLVLTVRGTGLVMVGGHNIGPVSKSPTGSSRIIQATLDGTDIIVRERYDKTGRDPRCCYSGVATVRWRWTGRDWNSQISLD